MSLENLRLDKPKSVWARFLQLKRWQKIVIVVVVVGLLGFGTFKVFGQKSNKQNYQTATAQKGSIISTVSESGNISASSQVSVTSPSTGIIQNVYVKNGDQVTAGQKLFEVKATATAQDKASAYASYMSAVNSAQSAQQSKQSVQATLEKDRQSVIDAQNAVNAQQNNSTNPSTKQTYTQLEIDSLNSTLTSSRETFTADETKYKQQDTAITAANAQLQSATLSYQATQDSVVTAPMDGTVANLSVSQGASVTASGNSNTSSNNSTSSNSTSTSTSGSSTSSSSTSSNSSGSTTSSGSTVLVLGNFSQLSVVAQVNEVDIPKIKVGQNATITLDAFSDKTFVGKVVSVNSIGTASSGVVTYDVYVNLVEPPTEIKSGMTASVIIQTARKDDVLTVPSAAVQTSNGSSYVRVLKNGKISQVAVTTGITSDTDTEISSGLNEGDVVVTGITATGTTSSSSTASPFGGLGGTRGGGGSFGGGTGGTRIRTN